MGNQLSRPDPSCNATACLQRCEQMLGPSTTRSPTFKHISTACRWGGARGLCLGPTLGVMQNSRGRHGRLNHSEPATAMMNGRGTSKGACGRSGAAHQGVRPRRALGGRQGSNTPPPTPSPAHAPTHPHQPMPLHHRLRGRGARVSHPRCVASDRVRWHLGPCGGLLPPAVE